MSHDTLLLNFPALHPELAGPGGLPLPAGLLFLGCGLHPAEPTRVTPADLPLDPALARKWLAEALAYGEQFATPGELAAQALGVREDFPAGGTAAIRAELLARERPADPADVAAAALLEARARAQALLLLADAAEERALEIAGLDQGLARSMADFSESLGLGDEDSAQDELGLPDAGLAVRDSVYEEYALPWRMALEAFWTLAPQGAALFTADPAVAASWVEEGQPLEPADETEAARLFPQGLPGGARLLSARLAGAALLGRAAAGKPWLAAERTVYALVDGAW
ncbi:MAG: hypothetical protein AB1916_06325 [Thermodesulfobacteriota bacterium]